MAVTHGLDPATPAVAVSRATRADQRTLAGTVSDLPAKLKAAPLPAPVLVLIGRSLAEADVFAAASAPDSAASGTQKTMAAR